jgi:hypothetical protein
MPFEPRLAMLPDSSMKLSGSIFRKIVRRIESIVPLAGDNIDVEQEEGGYKISLKGDPFTAVTITLDVCLDGDPSTILVYGPPTDEVI